MSPRDRSEGSVPIEELAALDSEVTHINKEVAHLRTEMRERFEKIDNKFEKVDLRMQAGEMRFGALEVMVTHVDKSFNFWSKVLVGVISGGVLIVLGAIWKLASNR